MENDLSLVPYEDLLKELDNRFEHWVFSGVKIGLGGQNGVGNILTVRKWSGNSATCSGLASMMPVAIYDSQMQDDEGDSDVEI